MSDDYEEEAIGEHYPHEGYIEKLEAQLREAAAFLDQIAHRFENWHDEEPGRTDKAAAECRAMAKRLRGENDEQSQT